jgi:mRNA-degrading endonuclease toxin of MazEF toxin-antitoxin module
MNRCFAISTRMKRSRDWAARRCFAAPSLTIFESGAHERLRNAIDARMANEKGSARTLEAGQTRAYGPRHRPRRDLDVHIPQSGQRSACTRDYASGSHQAPRYGHGCAITSTIRGAPSEVIVGVDEGLKQPSAVNLDHVQTVEQARLMRRLGQLNRTKMLEVCRALALASGCVG